MMNICPLPIDWLDFVEGNVTPPLEEHLATCKPCQLLVAKLRANVAPNTSLELRNGVNRRGVRLESGPAAPRGAGDIRWSAPLKPFDAAPERVPLLVLSDPWSEAGAAW